MVTLSLDAAPLGLAVRSSLLTALIGVAVLLPVQWRLHAKRVWSYLVYCLGYQLLALELDGSVVVTVVSFGVRHTRI
jgi:hypothetical protein